MRGSSGGAVAVVACDARMLACDARMLACNARMLACNAGVLACNASMLVASSAMLVTCHARVTSVFTGQTVAAMLASVRHVLTQTSRGTLLVKNHLSRTAFQCCSATMGGELINRLGRQDSGTVVGRCHMMRLMNRNSSVYRLGHNRLLHDHRLNMLVDVVVNTLSLQGGSGGRAMGRVMGGCGVLVLGCVGFHSGTEIAIIAVLKGLVLGRGDVVSVSLGKRLLGLDRLNSGMVMFLMYLTVYCGRDLFMTVMVNMLLRDRLTVVLLDSGTVLSVLGQEFRSELLGLVHVDELYVMV